MANQVICLSVTSFCRYYLHNITRQQFGLNSLCHFYRPQRSCGKVMFSDLSVILFRGGLSDRHPLQTRQTLLQTSQTPPGPGRHPLTRQTHPPDQADTPPPQMSQTSPTSPPESLRADPCTRQTPPSPAGESHCSGRYASYWKAFLLKCSFSRYTGKWRTTIFVMEFIWVFL